MKSLGVIGSQWGDEGKGKIVDYLAPKADIIIRFSGGNNAGHTVVVAGESFKLSLLPSAVLFRKKLCLAQGLVIDPQVLISEIDFFEKRFGRKLDLAIDPRIHVVMPYHKAWDAATEAWRGKNKVGSLHLGIGYCHSDKTNRFGLRFENLVHPPRLRRVIEQNYVLKKAIIEKVYGQKFTLEKTGIFKNYKKFGERLKPYLKDVSFLVQTALKQNKSILFEGAQGTFLDLAFGTYPYTVGYHVTSSAIFSGVGLPPFKLAILGIVKAYTTRVGGGPFKTEIFEKTGQTIREKGREYGTVSKRPRRCGWLDLVMLRHACRINGFSQIAFTKLDVLTGIKKIKICTHYKIGTKTTMRFPALSDNFNTAKPVYQEFEGWQEDITGITKFNHLPKNCQRYVEFVEKKLSIPIKYISLGPERKAMVIRSSN